ncbi:ATP-binding protein [Ammoniphilus sp. YIM 78166]|uniref:ATP-binding protein n=1 Tax=Ammoniphilus sp. YIM 78166 TaxID=1644106 RepID=UPI00106FB840|nr:ATP-binding protein [Ammoniphilus sp. YIM 78166]
MVRPNKLLLRKFKYLPIIYFGCGTAWILLTLQFAPLSFVYLSFLCFIALTSWLLYLGVVRYIELLHQAEQDLADTLREQQGFIFKYIKQNGQYVHTLCDGQLLAKVGLTPTLVIGKTIEEIFLGLDDDRRVYLNHFYARAWEGQQVTFEMTSLNGVTLYASLRPLTKDGKVVAVIGSCTDITEKIASQDLLVKSEKLSIVGQLAAGIAHEIRNPLTSIKGFLQFIKPQEEHQHFHEIMLSEIDRVEEIITEFLFLAKPQKRTVQTQDINLILQNVVKLFEPQALYSGVQISVEFPSTPKFLECEANHLKQVFINILKNSIESMSKGGTIRIKMTEESNMLYIRFTDEGCGIPLERISRLGEPFYTTKQKGSGLGLMVSYKIIEQHKGQIIIDSKLNEGTSVVISLPLLAHENENDLEKSLVHQAQ